MGMYSGANEVETTNSVYFTGGDYVAEIQVVKQLDHETKGEMQIAEFKIVESHGDTALKPGTTAAYFWKKGASKTTREAFFRDVKRFAGAVLDRDPDEVDDLELDRLASEANPAAGEKVRVRMTEIKTKAGGNFTKAQWMTP